MTLSKRRIPGERLPPLEFTSILDETVKMPGADLLHLQFRRFAGCPVCNLHLKTFARAHQRLRSAGVLTVSFFHSTREQMRRYQGELPFPCVPDPERRWYEPLVEASGLIAKASHGREFPSLAPELTFANDQGSDPDRALV